MSGVLQRIGLRSPIQKWAAAFGLVLVILVLIGVVRSNTGRAQTHTMSVTARHTLALLATLPTQQPKGGAAAATWLSPKSGGRCVSAKRQVEDFAKYHLWVTPADRDAIARVLAGC